MHRIIKPQAKEYLAKRGSPANDILVYSVAGHLLPGHSGAPIVDALWRVVAIGNGGLESGYVEMAWAIPWYTLEWKRASEVTSQLNTLATISPEYAFTFAAPPDYQPPRGEMIGSMDGPIPVAVNVPRNR